MDDSTALDDLFAPAAAEERRSTRVVDVLVPVALDRCYSYRAPESLDLKPGDLVSVPLGTRETLGIVWDADPDAPMGSGANLKAVSARHDWPPVSPTLRRFVDWIAATRWRRAAWWRAWRSAIPTGPSPSGRATASGSPATPATG